MLDLSTPSVGVWFKNNGERRHERLEERSIGKMDVLYKKGERMSIACTVLYIFLRELVLPEGRENKKSVQVRVLEDISGMTELFALRKAWSSLILMLPSPHRVRRESEGGHSLSSRSQFLCPS